MGVSSVAGSRGSHELWMKEYGQKVQSEPGAAGYSDMSGLGCCVPTGGCWRRRAGPTRPATSFGWVPTAGAPRAPPCCALRKWLRVRSPFFPRGCPCEVGPAGGCPSPTGPPCLRSTSAFRSLSRLASSFFYSLLHALASSMTELECRPRVVPWLLSRFGFWDA